MNTKIYFKRKSDGMIIEDVSFRNSTSVTLLKNGMNIKKLDAPMEIKRYTLEEAIISDDFHILTNDSFTEEELKILVTILYAQRDFNQTLVDKLFLKINNMLNERKYLPKM